MDSSKHDGCQQLQDIDRFALAFFLLRCNLH